MEERPAVVADPEAARVLDRYVAVTGGAEAYEHHRTRTTRARLQVASGDADPLAMMIRQARPDRSLTLIESDYWGTVRIGTAGGRGWRSDPFDGLRWLAPSELTALDTPRLDGPALGRAGLRRAEYLGSETLAGHPHLRLRLETHGGAVEERWYDRETELLTRLLRAASGDAVMGPVVADLSDYRWVDGLRLPYQSTRTALGEEQLTIIDSIEHDVELSDELFAAPAELVDPGCAG